MSGGSYNYMYNRVEETYCGAMFDPVLDGMMADLVGLLHDLEWWKSSDTSEDDYRKTVAAFKAKWMESPRGAIESTRKALEETVKVLKRLEEGGSR